MAAYGDDAAFVAYLAATGRTLPAPAVPAQLRASGTLWVDQWEQMFKGAAVSDENSFPRDLWATVPVRVEHAAYEAGYSVSQGVDIWGSASSAGGMVTREQVDTLSVSYATPDVTTAKDVWDAMRIMIPQAYALLQPYFRRGGLIGGGAFVV